MNSCRFIILLLLPVRLGGLVALVFCDCLFVGCCGWFGVFCGCYLVIVCLGVSCLRFYCWFDVLVAFGLV